MKQLLIFIWLGLCYVTANAQASLTFRSVTEVFTYADAHSVTFKNATQQTILSKYQTLAAQLSKWNLKGTIDFSGTDNTKLQSSFLPGQIFGGAPGSFKRITLGQRYVSELITSPQFDIMNPYAIAMVKVSKANEQVTNISNLLNKKSLYESLAASYYNVLSDQWQIIALKKSLDNADSLTRIMQKKQHEGIARVQDVNNSLANQLTIKNKLQQLEVQLAEEYNNMKLLCDIDPATIIKILSNVASAPGFNGSLTATGNLEEQQNEFLRKYQEADLRANKKWFLPTLSFFSSISFQQYTNNHFFDNSTWLGSNYLGLKLSIPLFPDVSKVANVKYDRINLKITENNIQHSRLQDSINNRQLLLDYRKAYSSYQISAQIEYIKKDSYFKNLNIYQEGIYTATDLLNSFNDWLNSSLDTVSQLANSEYEKSKILINNTIK